MASEDDTAVAKTKDQRPSPIPMELTDSIKGLFLPYVALKFTVRNTLLKSSTRTAYEALRCSFYAALDGLSLEDEVDKLWETDEEWQTMLQSKEYKDIISQLETLALQDDDVEEDDATDEDKLLKRWCDDSRSLDPEQLDYLLQVANRHHCTNFQLGVITEGFLGGVNPKTKVYEDQYVQPTTISIVHHGTTNCPMLWLYNDNADAREIAHGNRNRNSGAKPLHRWKALTVEEGKEAASRLRVVQNWQVGEQVDTDIEKGVWILERDQPDPLDANKIEAHAGCFMRLADDQSEAKEGFLVLQRANGNPIVVAKEDVEKILRDQKTPKRLDKTTDVAASQRQVDLPGTKTKTQGSKSVKGKIASGNLKKTSKSGTERRSPDEGDDTVDESIDGEENEGDKPGEKKPGKDAKTKKPRIVVEKLNHTVSFFRVVPPSKMCRKSSERMDGAVDPVFGSVEGFKVRTGDIVLDREKTDTSHGLPTRLVRNVKGKEGHVWERRLQRIPTPPFGLREDLFAVSTHQGGYSKAPAAELKALLEGLGLPVEGTVDERRKRISEELHADKINGTKRYLTVYKATSNINATIDHLVDIEVGEILIEDKDAIVGLDDLMLRDFEGIEAQVEKEDFKFITKKGWGLKFRNPAPLEGDKGLSNSLFNPDDKVPLPADAELSSENESEVGEEEEGGDVDNMDLDVKKKRATSSTKKRRHSQLEDMGESPSPHKIRLERKNGKTRIQRISSKQNPVLAHPEEKSEDDEEDEDEGLDDQEQMEQGDDDGEIVDDTASSGDDENEDDE